MRSDRKFPLLVQFPKHPGFSEKGHTDEQDKCIDVLRNSSKVHSSLRDNCVFITKPKPSGYGRGWPRHWGEPTVEKSSAPSPSEVPLWLYLWSQQIHEDGR